MKTITNEVKAKYFSLYYYRQVLGKYIDSDELAPIEDMNPCLVDYIELTLISDITDDHVLKLDFLDKDIFLIYGSRLHIWQQDLLRQLGYATEFTTIVKGNVVTYTVSDLIENGTIKLKTK